MSKIESGFFQSGGYNLSYKIHKNEKNIRYFYFTDFRTHRIRFSISFRFYLNISISIDSIIEVMGIPNGFGRGAIISYKLLWM